MPDIISDPDFKGFDGVYVGIKDGISPPTNEIDYNALYAYLKKTGKSFSDLTDKEVASLKVK